MDERANLVAVLCLAVLACVALVGIVGCSIVGQQIPAALGAAFGTAIGALAGLVPTRREPQRRGE